MTPVEMRLRRRIALTGPITVAEYMAACLTDPDGYYASREPFGTGGDFITAPEISQMFGELIGAWMLDRWVADGRPAPFDLVELGPGRGTLMADILSVVLRDAAFRSAVRIVLVEASERLKQTQRARLDPLHPRITWFERVPDDRPVYLVANEFFDALPVRQIVSRGGRWFERVVGLADDALAFGLAPFPLPAAAALPDGAVREFRPAAEAVMADIAGAIARHGSGAALVFDYGYTGPRDGETLQGVRAHAYVDVLDQPGRSDLSAHVDFAPLVAACRAAGAFPHGPRGQGDVLQTLGLLTRAGTLGASASPAQQGEITAAVNRLAGNRAGEMGELFRVLAVTAGSAAPPGFAA